ncbi:hypothetical protein [uncultured Catenibacterium sp.]
MFKRDNEAEGTFGDLKENMGYDRLCYRIINSSFSFPNKNFSIFYIALIN